MASRKLPERALNKPGGGDVAQWRETSMTTWRHSCWRRHVIHSGELGQITDTWAMAASQHPGLFMCADFAHLVARVALWRPSTSRAPPPLPPRWALLTPTPPSLSTMATSVRGYARRAARRSNGVMCVAGIEQFVYGTTSHDV